MLESPFNKVAGLQDCCKTYLLHALLRFYFSLAKTFGVPRIPPGEFPLIKLPAGEFPPGLGICQGKLTWGGLTGELTRGNLIRGIDWGVSQREIILEPYKLYTFKKC